MCHPNDFPPYDSLDPGDPTSVAFGSVGNPDAPVALVTPAKVPWVTFGGPAACRCGARQYPSEAEAHEAEPNGLFKCPTCHTFARDHSCSCNEDSDFRCYHCDVRHGSHGGPDGR